MKGLKIQNPRLILMMLPVLVELLATGIINNLNNVIFNKFSPNAVGVIGTGFQVYLVIINIYGIISVGTGIYLAQVVGAKRYDECNKIINSSIVLTFILSLSMSFFVLLSVPNLLKLINMPTELLYMGKQYLVVVIGLSFINAVLNTFTSIFRSLGRMVSVTATLISVNLISLTINYSIYRFIPMEQQSMVMYASTGAMGQIIGILIYLILLKKNKLFSFKISIKEGIRNSGKIVYRILRLGIPGGLETVVFFIGQTVVLSFVGILGAKAMFTRAIVGNITHYMSLSSATIITASAVIIGQQIGAGEIDEVNKSCKYNTKLSIAITIPVCSLLTLFSRSLLMIYTDDIEVINVGIQLLLLTCIMEVFRCVAGNYISGLKAVGDVDYPFFMVILGGLLNIGVSYYFGVYLSWGLPGIWIGYIADLAFRGIATVVRWNSGKWLKYVDRSSDL